MTLAEFAHSWLQRESTGRATNTRRNYATEIGYILPYLGTMHLQAIKPAHIPGMLDRMAWEGWIPRPAKANPDPRPKPYQTRTQQKALQRLSAIFRNALRLELVYRNPCEGVRVRAAPSGPKGKSLEPHQIECLVVACETHPMGLFFRQVLDTGLRKGEALALTWRDINLESKPAKLVVSKSWSSDGKAAGMMTTPKSRRSKRVVPIPESTADMLRALRAATTQAHGQGIQELYLFGSPLTNKPYDTQSHNHVLKRLCAKIGLPHVRVHDLRHTYGSVMLANRVPLEVVSERMGHANPTITLNVYRHVLEQERLEHVIDISTAARLYSVQSRQSNSLPN